VSSIGDAGGATFRTPTEFTVRQAVPTHVDRSSRAAPTGPKLATSALQRRFVPLTSHLQRIVVIMRRFPTVLSGLALALALSSAAHAQSIGFKLGAAMANQYIDPDEETNAITGFAGGGFIRFGTGRIGVQLEALSITKGAELDATDLKRKIEYVEVPLLLHLPLTLGQSFAPYVIGGPSVAFDISCEEEAAGGDTNDCPDREKTDFGLSAGGGLGFAVGPGALLLEGRYTWGLKNIEYGRIEGEETKNRNALFIAGYEIPIGRR
jgi:hypothetical protein